MLLSIAIASSVRAADPKQKLALEKVSPEKLSPEKLKEVNKLLSQYRAAGTDMAKKQDICQQVLLDGPAAAPLMLAA